MSDAMNGKTVAITGATGGVGFYSALEIAGLGAEVILIRKNPERAQEAAERIRSIQINRFCSNRSDAIRCHRSPL